jgi:hypothetical protein
MYSRWIVFLGLGWVILGCVGSGCRPAGDGPEVRSETAQVAKVETGLKNPDAALQGKINQLASLAIEHSPAKRRRVVSDRAADTETWVRQVLERGHEESGFGDGPGTAEARVAFGRYARIFRGGPGEAPAKIVEAARSARNAGSMDPFLQYLMVRYHAVPDTTAANLERAGGMVEAANALHGTRHHPLLQFLVGYRATANARHADRNTVRDHLNVLVNVHMEDAVRDTNTPPQFLFEHLVDWLRFTRTPAWVDWVLEDTGALVTENWGETSHYHGLMAEVGVLRAWNARGSGYANTVTDQGWKKMEAELAAAERHLDQAWEMGLRNRALALVGMQIELGQGKGRAVAELWFERAMQTDPDNYEACMSMAYYLEPKWHGSEEECLQFARKCAGSEVWGGQVPLVLVDVHHKLAAWKEQKNDPAYWGRPQVWTDLQDSYEKFFWVNANPEAQSYRHNYARDAFLCGKYDAFLTQVGKFTSGTNHGFFGGAAAFDGMLSRARAATGK